MFAAILFNSYCNTYSFTHTEPLCNRPNDVRECLHEHLGKWIDDISWWTIYFATGGGGEEAHYLSTNKRVSFPSSKGRGKEGERAHDNKGIFFGEETFTQTEKTTLPAFNALRHFFLFYYCTGRNFRSITVVLGHRKTHNQSTNLTFHFNN